MKKIMKSPSVTWWILGLTMMVFSFFLWPSPSVALVGAIMLPFAVRAGLNPLTAAVAMNLFGHGIALSCDFIIQGAPAVSAAAAGFGRHSLEKVTDYVTDGFLFAIRIFAPVIIIGAFFFLGGSGINDIFGFQMEGGIMNDWAIWLASHAPLNKYMAAFIQMVVGGLTGLDGSGFSGLPLTGALAHTFGTATGASAPLLAALGQITAIFVGGGTIVPWGLIPVAAICNVSPLDLASKNMRPVFIGFLAAFLTACVLL